MDYDMIVIGAGSAGLTYAIGANSIGAKVLLIEKHKIGGDCTHYGCVPSKALIHLSKEMKILNKYGAQKYILSLDDAQKKVQEIVQGIYKHETPQVIKKLGIDVEIGNAVFKDENSIEINNKVFVAKKIIIATGSHARTLSINGLEDNEILTNKEIFNFTGKSLAIIGCGPIGCELAQAFANFNCEIHLINNSNQILSREDNKASKLVEEEMNNQGINIYHNSNIISGKKLGDSNYELYIKHTKQSKILSAQNSKNFEGSKTRTHTKIKVDGILQSIGRIPNTKGLGFEELGIEINNRGVCINKSTQTSISHIYAIGDVAGTFQFTHFANHMAKVALTKSIFKIPSSVAHDTPRITFTQPEIASIGNTQEDENSVILYKSFNEVDKALCENKKGFYKIICDKKGRIIGATIVGDSASELIGEIGVMMSKQLNVSDISNVIHAYPSYGYGLRNTFDQFRAKGYNENKKKWVQRIFGLNGSSKTKGGNNN